MKKRILLALAAIASITTIKAEEPEFYVELSDNNIVTYANTDISHIVFLKIDATTKQPTTEYATQAIIMANGDTVFTPFTGMKKVILSDMITTGDSIIDLGLSVKWASKNYGATAPNEYGTLVGWGDPTGTHHEQYHTSSYGAYDKNKNTVLGYYGGVTPPDTICGTTFDIASVKIGNGWRLPRYDEAVELIDSCQWQWMKYRGVEGVKVTGSNGKSLFLAAGGMRRGEKMTSAENNYGGYWTGS